MGIRGEATILKPKGEVGRPGGGGYNLFQALDWNQKTYDNVHVSKRGIYMKGIYFSPIHQSPNHKAFVVKIAREKLDITKSYRGQSKAKVDQLIEMVSYINLQSSRKLTKFRREKSINSYRTTTMVGRSATC